MKCELCGAEWIPCVQTISQAKCAHEKNSCVLAGLDMLWEPDISIINAALKAAKEAEKLRKREKIPVEGM